MISGGNYFRKKSQRSRLKIIHEVGHDVEVSTQVSSAGEDVEVEIPQSKHRYTKKLCFVYDIIIQR